MMMMMMMIGSHINIDGNDNDNDSNNRTNSSNNINKVITKHVLTLSLLSIAAPFSINNLAISKLPLDAAACSGVSLFYEII